MLVDILPAKCPLPKSFQEMDLYGLPSCCMVCLLFTKKKRLHSWRFLPTLSLSPHSVVCDQYRTNSECKRAVNEGILGFFGRKDNSTMDYSQMWCLCQMNVCFHIVFILPHCVFHAKLTQDNYELGFRQSGCESNTMYDNSFNNSLACHSRARKSSNALHHIL